MRTLTALEIEALLTASATLAARPGAQRQGELLGLRWSDLNLSEGYIDVREQLTQDGERTAPKTRVGTRRLYLAPELASYLREHKAALATRKMPTRSLPPRRETRSCIPTSVAGAKAGAARCGAGRGDPLA